MATFVVTDRESLEEALQKAEPKDRIVIAEGAFEEPPRLEVRDGRWRIVRGGSGLQLHHWDLI